MHCEHMIEYYSALIKEVFSFVTMWKDSEGIMLSEISK